jgi:hypothetical protein
VKISYDQKKKEIKENAADSQQQIRTLAPNLEFCLCALDCRRSLPSLATFSQSFPDSRSLHISDSKESPSSAGSFHRVPFLSPFPLFLLPLVSWDKFFSFLFRWKNNVISDEQFCWTALSYVGQGMIMGHRTTGWMLIGAVLGWGILAPVAQSVKWAPGPFSDLATGPAGWLLWVSLGILLTDSITQLAVVVWNTLRGPRGQGENVDRWEQEWKMGWWWWAGLGGSVLVCVVGMEVVAGVSWWRVGLGVALGALVSVLAVRALGQTDLNPASGVGKISQLIFGVLLARGDLKANLIGGAIAEAGTYNNQKKKK